MKIRIALVALVLCNSAVASDKLSIAGIAPGDRLSDITAKLGHPADQERRPGDFIVLRVKFKDLTFGLDEDGLVAEAKTTNPKYCFNDWLCPGDLLSNVRGKLPDLTRLSVNSPYIVYSHGDGCWLEITAPAKKIKSLAIKCQP